MSDRTRSTRRGVLAGIGTAATVGLAGCNVLGGGETTAELPDGPVANAPIPNGPGQYDYETMGDGDTPAMATYFANWKCPHCAEFSTGFLGTIVSEYVEPGDLAIQHRALAYTSNGPWMGEDAPRAARAGLAVWNIDPDSYWRYHEHVMANQGSSNETWATTDRLVELAEQANVSDPDGVRSALEDGEYDDTVRATTTAAGQAGVRGTPTLVVDGTAVNALDESAVRDALDSAISA